MCVAINLADPVFVYRQYNLTFVRYNLVLICIIAKVTINMILVSQ